MTTRETTMHASPSHLPLAAREAIAHELNAVLADGLDLHGQLKVAHWNLKGPLFATLHPLFETFAEGVAAHTDDLAERAVTLGALAYGTARHVAETSRIPAYPETTTRDLDHVRLLAERFEAWLQGLRGARAAAETHADTDTVDLLTGVITAVEKNGWFLRATIEKS